MSTSCLHIVYSMSTSQIDRKIASRLLNMTVRTVDRYIAAGKLQADKADGRIWLNKKEVLDLKAKRRHNLAIQRIAIPHEPVDMSIDDVYSMSTSNRNGNVQNRAVEKENPSDHYSGNNEKETPAEIYKKLFRELQQELKIRQERLEGANYRVGQLEALVKDSIPRLDHINALNEAKQLQDNLQKQLHASQQQLHASQDHLQKSIQEAKGIETHLFRNLEQAKLQSENLSTQMKTEKSDKRIYLVLLFIILLLQPLWLLLSLR